MKNVVKLSAILFSLSIMPALNAEQASVWGVRNGTIHALDDNLKTDVSGVRATALDDVEQSDKEQLSPEKIKEHKRSDKKAAKRVADYVVSQEFVIDVNALVTRSADPMKEYIRNYFFHCDFHKDQLKKMKQCFGEFDQLLEESMPICVHALFSYIVSDAMKEHVQKTAQNALDTRSMAIYAAPSIMEHIEEQDGVLSHKEREQFIVLKDRWNKWYERWSDYLIQMSSYVEARTEVREQFLDEHKKSLLFSMLWVHAGPAIWFFMSKFRIARTIFGSSVHDANYFLMKLMLRLHENVTMQRTTLEKKIIERTQDSLDLYMGIINQVIDENLARF